MSRWVLDTNLYIRASHNREARRALNAFHDRHFARTDLAATVWLELQVGVRERSIQVAFDEWVDTFVERDAVLTRPRSPFSKPVECSAC
ncbi:MAG: hypothetical protein NUW01_08000 [Gemmatimonadaceae bacterium]|nr:hypothetical protein [Gemmatimonadaceae bacterium]